VKSWHTLSPDHGPISGRSMDTYVSSNQSAARVERTWSIALRWLLEGRLVGEKRQRTHGKEE
jgi:hypothetical protein